MSEKKRVAFELKRYLDDITAEKVYGGARKKFLNEYLKAFFANEGYSVLSLESGIKNNPETAERVNKGKFELIIKMQLKEKDISRFKENINNSLDDKLYERLRNTPEKWI